MVLAKPVLPMLVPIISNRNNARDVKRFNFVRKNAKTSLKLKVKHNTHNIHNNNTHNNNLKGSLVHTQEECLALLRWHRERAAHKETFTKDERGEMRLMIKIICKLYHERQLHALERRQRRDRRDRPQQQPQQLQQQKEAEKEEGGERKTTGKRERKQKAITTTYRQFMCLMAGDVGSSSKLNRVRHRASVVLPLFEGIFFYHILAYNTNYICDQHLGKLSYVIKHIDEEKVYLSIASICFYIAQYPCMS